jgi:hypothetical protein
MTPEEAIAILTEAIKNRYLPLCKNLDDATKLGIEALKFKQGWNDGYLFKDGYLLPGETKE